MKLDLSIYTEAALFQCLYCDIPFYLSNVKPNYVVDNIIKSSLND